MDRRVLFAGAASIAVAAALAFAVPATGGEDAWSAASLHARFPDPDAAAKKDDFAGTSACKECHENRWKSLDTSAHAKPLHDKDTSARMCESCHGPGAQHAESGDAPIRDPLYTADLTPPAPVPAKPDEEPRKHVTVPVKDMNGVCLRCHVEDAKGTPIGTTAPATKPSAKHRDWVLPADGRERSCVSCHSVHVPAPAAGAARPDTIADLAKIAQPVDPKLCIACHTQMAAPVFHPQMARSGHAFLLKDGPDHGCAACHGNGSLHVQAGGDPSRIVNPRNQKPRDSDATCNACHAKGDAVAKWTCAEHERQGVSCIVCHDANAPRGRTLRKPEFQLCGQCHLDVQASFRLPNSHRVAAGRVSCSDCHDPHGNTDKVRDKDVRYRACLQCHQDKGGPFLYDHGIKRDEGCTACHDPHGSVNRRMLTYPKVRPLCLQCHPETPHDLRKPQFQNCLDCHTEIHGSDLNRRFLR
jgi:DmsE family decaheme c-type cytochrome